MKKAEWKLVLADKDSQQYVERFSVPGGWLYKVEQWGHVQDGSGGLLTCNVVFVPSFSDSP